MDLYSVKFYFTSCTFNIGIVINSLMEQIFPFRILTQKIFSHKFASTCGIISEFYKYQSMSKNVCASSEFVPVVFHSRFLPWNHILQENVHKNENKQNPSLVPENKIRVLRPFKLLFAGKEISACWLMDRKYGHVLHIHAKIKWLMDCSIFLKNCS